MSTTDEKPKANLLGSTVIITGATLCAVSVLAPSFGITILSTAGVLILLAILSRKNQAVLVSGFTLCAALLALAYPDGVSAARKTWLAVVLQAALFGVYHYSATSVPDGVIGVVLTFAYGIMLGYLRVAANGLMAPWVAHTIADAVVFALIMGNR